MKNKGLIGTLIVLVVLVVGSMLYDQTKSDSHRNEKVKIGILQYVTHEALEEIERGIEQGLASATSDIPVVMGAISDPVGAKLVKKLGKPNSNVTGVSNQVPLKQTVELIQSITPNAKTIGVLYASSEDNSVSQVAQFKEYAKSAGINVVEYAVPSTNEITT